MGNVWWSVRGAESEPLGILRQCHVDDVTLLVFSLDKSSLKTGSLCTALVVGSDDVASSYSIGVLTRRQVGRREGSRGTRVVASY